MKTLKQLLCVSVAYWLGGITTILLDADAAGAPLSRMPPDFWRVVLTWPYYAVLYLAGG